MGKYSLIKKAFAFLEAEYGFREFMRQKHGSYYYIAWTNDKKDIMVLYDDTVDDKRESRCVYGYMMQTVSVPLMTMLPNSAMNSSP